MESVVNGFLFAIIAMVGFATIGAFVIFLTAILMNGFCGAFDDLF